MTEEEGRTRARKPSRSKRQHDTHVARVCYSLGCHEHNEDTPAFMQCSDMKE